MPAYIQIKANGTVLPNPFNEQQGLGDYTQIYSLYSDAGTMSENQTGRSAPRITVAPYAFVKALDGISPRIKQAYVQGQVVEAVLKIRGKHPQTGQDRTEYEIELKDARIIGIRLEMQQPLSGGAGPLPSMERIIIAPQRVDERSLISNYEFNHTPNGAV